MLRISLTGGLGSGKSTVARMFSEMGAQVSAADEIGRGLMQPGQPAYAGIVRLFGGRVVQSDGALDRKALAELAFQQNHADMLNRIVHPAVIAAEEQWMRAVFEQNPAAIAIVESALIFEVEKWGTAPDWPHWIDSFDKLILVAAPDEVKIARFVARSGGERRASLERDARARLALQIPDQQKALRCDYIIHNTGPLEETRKAVQKIYAQLQSQAGATNTP